MNDSLAFGAEAGSSDMASIARCRNAGSLDKASSIWDRVNEKKRAWHLTLKVIYHHSNSSKTETSEPAAGIAISHHSSR